MACWADANDDEYYLTSTSNTTTHRLSRLYDYTIPITHAITRATTTTASTTTVNPTYYHRHHYHYHYRVQGDQAIERYFAWTPAVRCRMYHEDCGSQFSTSRRNCSATLSAGSFGDEGPPERQHSASTPWRPRWLRSVGGALTIKVWMVCAYRRFRFHVAAGGWYFSPSGYVRGLLGV